MAFRTFTFFNKLWLLNNIWVEQWDSGYVDAQHNRPWIDAATVDVTYVDLAVDVAVVDAVAVDVKNVDVAADAAVVDVKNVDIAVVRGDTTTFVDVGNVNFLT
jgi:hypothetical protein